MDEPLANLDPGLRRQLRDELMALKNRLDLTCIYVTHDQTEAMTMGDRVVLLNRGYVKLYITRARSKNLIISSMPLWLKPKLPK